MEFIINETIKNNLDFGDDVAVYRSLLRAHGL